MDVAIRPAAGADDRAIDAVIRAAFGAADPEEGDKVADLWADVRDAGLVLAELVAVVGDEVVGHVGVSHCWLDARRELVDVAMLSPLSTLPDHQGAGIGTALVAAAVGGGRAPRAGPRSSSRAARPSTAARGFERRRRVRPRAAVAAHARAGVPGGAARRATPTG